MAKSKYEYVKNFEIDDKILPNCWIVVRIDGKNFHSLSDKHEFEKPNDARALNLMNKAAERVMTDFPDICLAYGQSDEYSFVLRRSTTQYKRRQSKLVSLITSLFSSSYVFHWPEYFPQTNLLYPPSFDGRAVYYPTTRNLRDYLSWRQADCHINNLYNTCFWKLVLLGQLSRKDAQERLKGTTSADKHELLFSLFAINYNEEPEINKKGSVLTREKLVQQVPAEGAVSCHINVITVRHVDIIGEKFWRQNPDIVGKDTDNDS